MSQYNPNAMAYGHVLRINKQMLAENQALTTASVAGNGTAVMADRTQGSMAIVIQATKALSVAANGTIVVTLEQAENFEMTGASQYPVMFNKTFTVATPVVPGTVVGILPIGEDVLPYIKAKISGTAGLTVDLVATYVPR